MESSVFSDQLSVVSKKETKRVAVGLSGGVDSSLSSALLAEAGYQVTGVFLECWRAPGCRVDEDRKDALDVAMQLGIPYQVLDFKKEYKEKVVDYFYREYQAGRTPNPDTMCNREIKFGMFYQWAMQNGFDFVATGHYARIKARNSKHEIRNKFEKINSNITNIGDLDLNIISDFDISASNFLVRGADPKKDQSYFLYQLRPEQLEHILFPIGHLTKDQVRDEAKKRGLKTATKPDSQGICFIGEVNVQSFLREKLEERQGRIIIKARNSKHEIRNKFEKINSNITNIGDLDLNIISDFDISASNFEVGSHPGAHFYTIGQKVGKEIDQALVAKLAKQGILDLDPANMPHLFVIEKGIDTNTLIIGTQGQLNKDTFKVGEVNWIVGGLDNQQKETDYQSIQLSEYLADCFVRIRHGGKLVRASITPLCSEEYQVDLAEPIKGVASGQACVIYSSDKPDAIVIGGGIIA